MERIAHFRIVSKIGEGGMGAVYRAQDEKLQRTVAIKVLPESQFTDPTAKARLLREARAAAGLTHPNICVVHEVGEVDGQAYIAMECVEGESLADRITRAPLSTAEVIRFGIQLADALAHAHERGIVHRDLKPANIIVTPERRLKVLDFGLAKKLVESADPGDATDVLVTVAGKITGTPAYMSPEQLSGLGADARSDIWAMGVILHEMASRERPFAGTTLASLSASILTAPPQPLPAEVPAELGAIVRRCLEKEPANRYASAAEVRSALEVIQSTAGVSRPLPLPKRRKRWMVGAATALIVAIALIGVTLRRLDAGHARPSTAAGPANVAPAAARPVAVAVLPFSSFSGAEEEYLAAGMQDSVIGELGRVKGLRVISRTSTLAFKSGGKSATEIAKALNTDDLVEGSVVHAGNRIRVEVKLIRTSPQEQQVWAEAYERDMQDVLALYGEIAAAVATQIDARLAGQAVRRTTRKVDPEVYQLYLKGRFQLKQETDEGFRNGIALLKQANAKDPSDPLPYAAMAVAYALYAHSPNGTPDMLEIARAAAHKALEIDPDQGEAHAAVAFLKQYGDWKMEGLEQDWRRTLELNPTDSEFRRHFAWYLIVNKRGDEALAQMKRARDDDPLSGIYYSDVAWILQILGRYDEALAEARRGVELTPNDNDFYVLGIVYDSRRMFDQAVEAHRKLVKIAPSMKWGLAYTLVLAGRDAEARPIIDELTKSTEADAAFGLAQIYAAKGNKEEAFRWLDIARKRHAVWSEAAGVFAEFRPLRGDPRMASFLATFGLPDVEPGFGRPKV